MHADVKPRRPASRTPDCAALEDRILMSATPVPWVPEIGLYGEIGASERPPQHLIAPLSGGESGGPGLEALPIPVLMISEDANNYTADLASFFTDGGDELTYLLLSNSNEELFEEIAIDQNSETLEIDFAGNAHGHALLTLRAIDGGGHTVDNDFEINVNPINDRPTTSGFSNVIVSQGTESTVIDLFAAFDDVEDPDELLSFEVVSLSNPDLFAAVSIDHQLGTLSLDYAEGVVGHSEIVLRATDTEGLSVEMTTAGAEFPVHQFLGHWDSIHRPDFQAMGVDPFMNFTSYAFFEYDPDTGYDYSQFSESQLRWALDYYVPQGYANPVVFNIELHSFGNSPEGRDNLASVLDVAREERPELQLGFYRLLPERNWWAPVGYQRGLDDIANGNLDSFWARNFDSGNNYEAEYNSWLARNELYRTEEVTSSLGGGTVAERVDAVYPSLYMPYEPGLDLSGMMRNWQIYAEHNIAEARKFDVPVKPYISHSVVATGQSFLPKEFFRHQLDVLYELSDSILIWGTPGQDPFVPENSGWLEALDEFMRYLHTPTSFAVSVQPSSAPVANPLPTLTLGLGALSGQIDLWGLFDDVDHTDGQLVYSVANITNETNLQDWVLDSDNGELQFTFADSATGHAEFLVRATDPDGWVAENTVRVSLPTFSASGSYASFGFEIFEDATFSSASGLLPEVSSVVFLPMHAESFELAEDGSLIYSPSQDWSGVDQIRYETVVGEGLGQVSTLPSIVDVQIYVAAVNDAPTATGSHSFVLRPGMLSLTVDLTRLFADVDNEVSSLQFQVASITGELIDAIDVNNETDSVVIEAVPDTLGTSQISIYATDASGATAINSIVVTRSAAGVTVGDQSGGQGSLPTGRLNPVEEMSLTLGGPADTAVPPDEEAFIAQQIIDLKSAVALGARVSDADDDDKELVSIPLLSLGSLSPTES